MVVWSTAALPRADLLHLESQLVRFANEYLISGCLAVSGKCDMTGLLHQKALSSYRTGAADRETRTATRNHQGFASYSPRAMSRDREKSCSNIASTSEAKPLSTTMAVILKLSRKERLSKFAVPTNAA